MSSTATRRRRVTRPDRPRGVLVVIAVNIVLGVLSIIAAVITLSTSTAVPSPKGLGFLQPLAPVFPAVEVFLGSFFLVVSYGLFTGRRWAWRANVAFELIHIVADIGFVASRSFAIDKVIGLAVIFGVLGYLTRPRVREYFNQTEPRPALGPSGR